MASSVKIEKPTEGKRPTDRVRLGMLLGGALAVGFLLGYLASAFVPLIRPSPSTSSSPSTATAPKLPPSEIDAVLKAAHASLDAGDLQTAWDKYHQILMTDPHNVEALTHLGNILMRGNQLDEAIRLYDRALRFDPNYAHALFDKGQALKEKGDARGAAEVWRKFLTLMPADSDDAKKVKAWLAELGQSGRSALKKGDGKEK